MPESGNLPKGLTQPIFGRRARHLREYATGYLMIAPAILIIFVFGIFPVGFALYVSLHKWVIVRSDFVGLENYVDAVGNFTYIVLFGMGVGGIAGAFLLARRIFLNAQLERRPEAWFLAIPAALHATATLAFFRWAFFQLPEFLDIAAKMRGLDRT